MKTSEVKIGGLYEAKVSGKIQVVRITSMREAFTPDGQRSLGMRFDAVNVATGRAIYIRSPQRLRRAVATYRAPGNAAIEINPHMPWTAPSIGGES